MANFSLQLRSETYQYRSPMKFGGRVVNDVTVLSVDCHAETQAGRETGLGSMTMGVAWAWPSSQVDDETKLRTVVELSHRIARAYENGDQTGHPLDICHRIVEERARLAAELAKELELSEPIPELAVLLAASPIESALFDAHGKAASKSSYAMLGRDHLANELDHYLGSEFKGLHLSDLISATPRQTLPLYHLVGALDPLETTDLVDPIGDQLPETLGDWIDRNGLTHLKIKLDGADLEWDVQRVKRIAKVALERRAIQWAFSLDFNERCESEDYVLELLDRLESESEQAFDFVQYIEQPTHRDLNRPGQATMHRAAKRRPVVIDESLIDLQSLQTAIDQGYSGIALKACKGHSEALLLGAVARHKELFLCVQDLTCVGASLLHSASLAAHIPGAAAVESNGRQYAPAGNERWMERFSDFFEVRGGSVPTGQLSGPGLGYGDDPAVKSLNS
ncbi:MAG: mandelate racemase/muconate lactonizing enzyme family protein [Planctomycetota bacterium]